VASHRSIDYGRRRKYRPIALDDVAEPAVTDAAGDILLSRKLRELIATLAEKPRMVMVLRYQEDLMPEEIAKTLDMPVRTVKSHLHRSLALLREKIGNVGEVG
jgi:RNA polymerase sigma-70 factor, ECF subfamily